MVSSLLVVLLLPSVLSLNQLQWRPCIELKRDLVIPCKCAISADYPRSIEMNCDRVIFTRDTLSSLYGQPITSISQKNCGYQILSENLINSDLNLKKLDLSSNLIYRLMDRVLQTQSELHELRLNDNLLGDNLNPIFSSNEFHGMRELKILDISRNGLKNIEEGLLKGCVNLEELYLDGNNLTAIPTNSLEGPRAIKVLSLAGNNIESLSRGVFDTMSKSLLRLDLSGNELFHIEDGALSDVQNLLFFNISHNSLSHVNSDVFKGIFSLLQLDLSANFFQEFPSDALRHLTDLKYLNMSNNLLTEIERIHLLRFNELQVLDLSRNNIVRLGSNTFSNLIVLSRLDLSFNALRTIEESSFDGLTKLKWLSLQDNNILLVPTSALTLLPSLAHLHMQFNRIAALSTELIRATSTNLMTLSLTRNLVRDIPPRLFYNFKNLISIELSGNMLSNISQNMFVGLEDTLQNLDISYNQLTAITELPLRNLISLNLAGNKLKQVSSDAFKYLHKLQYLNLSSNPLYGGFPPIFPSFLINLDISCTELKILPTVLLLNLESLERISLGGNQLQKIDEGTFQYLYNLTTIDLSYNAIKHIDNNAFVGLMNLYSLKLRGNRLTWFIGEHFNTGTGLEILDLSYNRINYLSPTAFAIHPRLKRLDLSGNRIVQFCSNFIKSLQFLEWLDLSRNMLRHVNKFAFSQIGRLRDLDLSDNRIESVDELAFHNSTQLQLLDLSGNVLETLHERTLEGLLRLESLNLRDNRLTSLPETIFDTSRIHVLERIDLSGNRFNEIPIHAIQRQLSLFSLKLARNRVVEVFTQDFINNVKELDLSKNPLSENAIRSILGEAKILRSLNLANTNIKTIPRLETPFLKHLNLSDNAIADIKPVMLERTTILENLDISKNRLTDLTNLTNTFKNLSVLQSLDISDNEIKNINKYNFDRLSTLRSLKMANLLNCTRIEKNAFRSLTKLQLLYIYNYPKLGYLDVQGILKNMTNLEILDIEIKDSSVSNEQLSMHIHPYLRELTLRGERLRNILSSSLVGVRGPRLFFSLKNTSVDTIPPALFFPVPRSTKVELNVSGSKFINLSSQLLAALDERGGYVKINGLDNNPINCSCEMKHLWKWLMLSDNKAPIVICGSPNHLAGTLLNNLTEENFLCNRTTLTKSQTTETSSLMKSTTLNPEIIWTVVPTVQSKNNNFNNDRIGTSTINNISNIDDTLIIGIVGSVVAFIVIIIIIICICRLRWGNQMQEAGNTAMASSSIHEASMIRSVYSGKINPYNLYINSYNSSTLGGGGNNSIPLATSMQIMPYVQPIHMMRAVSPPSPSLQIYGYYDDSSFPMYITDNKLDK